MPFDYNGTNVTLEFEVNIGKLAGNAEGVVGHEEWEAVLYLCRRLNYVVNVASCKADQ